MDINLNNLTPDVRSIKDMEAVVYDKEWFITAPNADLYYMYRGIEEKNDIRYDITVVPAKMLGEEFVKTKGHYHMGKHPEVYTVLDGQSIYLMQKRKADSENEIEDVYAVQCQKGDVVVIPPDYGHITINPSPTNQLKMANWISRECKSDYSLFEKFQGACYYFIASQSQIKADVTQTNADTKGIWVKNPNYQQVPELRFEKPLKEVPQDLDFLKVS